MRQLARERRAPRAIVLENVCGALTSHGGADFVVIAEAIASAGYRFGALIVDAAHFAPQSRPRLFIVALAGERPVPRACVAPGPLAIWAPSAVGNAHARLVGSARAAWVWWALPAPAPRAVALGDILEEQPGSAWHTQAHTDYLLSLMGPPHRAKLIAAQKSGDPMVGALFRRTRTDSNGARRQRAEVRFDGLAGCLRTPAGGSSRQILLTVRGEEVRSRLISGREAARLMGLPDTYRLPERANDALHLLGDGVAVPVVRHLAVNLLEPLAAAREPMREAAE
jgi:DNA (cytosine-5)-methyltransferase 1